MWVVIDGIIAVLVSMVSFVFGFIYETFSIYVGFSITFLILVGVPMLYAIL